MPIIFDVGIDDVGQVVVAPRMVQWQIEHHQMDHIFYGHVQSSQELNAMVAICAGEKVKSEKEGVPSQRDEWKRSNRMGFTCRQNTAGNSGIWRIWRGTTAGSERIEAFAYTISPCCRNNNIFVGRSVGGVCPMIIHSTISARICRKTKIKIGSSSSPRQVHTSYGNWFPPESPSLGCFGLSPFALVSLTVKLILLVSAVMQRLQSQSPVFVSLPFVHFSWYAREHPPQVRTISSSPSLFLHTMHMSFGSSSNASKLVICSNSDHRSELSSYLIKHLVLPTSTMVPI